ncbi:MAG TPA: hypothetical protein VK589_14370 [Chryseolinea sp.]|nr:hypothetical protein [Chryseolinea sp.]
MRTLICIISFVAFSTLAVAQAKSRRLPSIINHPSRNCYAPYLSFDGNALLFVSNDGEDGILTVSYTTRETDWVEPVILPKNVNHRLVYLRGFSLSADGKKMYFTGTKSPIVGGYDIMTSDLKGNTWGEPQNLMMPVNSKTNDGCPSVTADGNTMYFMRCDRMDQYKADGCKLFSAKKKSNGQWDEPKELPANINTGNSQTPRIMADGETLIFSSNKMTSTQGGMDLYVTKLVDGSWSEPRAMDFANTPQDDQFVSVAALGRYLLKEAPGSKKNVELVEFLIPNELRPKGMMKIEGTITDPSNAPVSAYISVRDLTTNKRVFSGRPNADGSYMLYLSEGTKYEMSIDPEQSNISYTARQFDLMTDKIPQREKVNVTLKQPSPGDELSLDFVSFKPNSAELDPSSETDLKRFLRVAKANPNLKFEIQVMLNGYQQDTVMSNADLTEVMVDSLQTQMEEIDSLGQLYKKDTVIVKRMYHNDRTLLQAQNIIAYLSSQGVPADNFTYLGNAIPATLPDNKKITIKAVARAK